MGRAVYQHELTDPDFVWLLSRFQETHPQYIFIESTALPAIFIKGDKNYGLPAGLFIHSGGEINSAHGREAVPPAARKDPEK